MTQDFARNGTTIHTIDLHFMNAPGAIAAYLIPHSDGAVLIECGPGSTVEQLRKSLEDHGLKPSDISDVLLTHIHLDHAGAAGWLASHGARVHVHPVGAPHMLNPEKLLGSAARIYGDLMDTMWGEFLPVPEDLLSVISDDVIEINGLRFRPLDTPGHAYHHFVYFFEDVCFSGDIGGVRMKGLQHLRLPMPPPEFHLELWRESWRKLQFEYSQGTFKRIAPTHFGIYEDVEWHLEAIGQAMDEVEAWMLKTLPSNPTLEQLNEQFVAWTNERALAKGFNSSDLQLHETANPSWTSSSGILRYWRKHRAPEVSE